MTSHRITWYGVIPGYPPERVRRNRHMAGGDWGWDATCDCGWDSRTGGAIQARIREDIERHKWDVAYDATHCVACGSGSLWSNFFDADDLAVDGRDPAPGTRWTTFCADCGSEQ